MRAPSRDSSPRRLRKSMSRSRLREALLTAGATLLVCGRAGAAGSPSIVISQVYGGGGNSGATYKNDFIELHNNATTNVDITGWSVQYASATVSSWSKTDLSGIVPPGCYYLVEEDSSGSTGSSLPTPDATGTINLSATAGQVALVNNVTVLTTPGPTGLMIVDFVGFGASPTNYEGSGPAPTPSNTTSDQRKSQGTLDTDNNASDFATGTPAPRNSSSPRYPPDASLAVTNPPVASFTVGSAVTSYTLSGTSSNLVGVFTWTNALTGASGNLPAATNWSVAGVALQVGDNLITVSGTNAAGVALGVSVTISRQEAGPLAPGDVALIGMDVGSDAFSFVTLAPLPAGSVLYFTDNGWSNTQYRGTAPASDYRGRETLLKFVAESAIAAGTVIRTSDASNAFVWVNSGAIPPGGGDSFSDLALNNNNGEQVYAFQGPHDNPLYAPLATLFVLDNTGAFETATDSNTGDVAPGLTPGSTALTFGKSSGNYAFMAFTNFAGPAKRKEQWLAAIANSNNWQFDASGTLPAGQLAVIPPPPRGTTLVVW